MEDLTGKMSSKLSQDSILGKSVQIDRICGLPLCKCHNSTVLFLWLLKLEEHSFFLKISRYFLFLVQHGHGLWSWPTIKTNKQTPKPNHPFLVGYFMECLTTNRKDRNVWITPKILSTSKNKTWIWMTLCWASKIREKKKEEQFLSRIYAVSSLKLYFLHSTEVNKTVFSDSAELRFNPPFLLEAAVNALQVLRGCKF